MAVHGNMAGAEQHPDIANQRLLTHKGKTLAALAFLFKHQSNRLDIYIQADGGLKQAGMKRLYIQPRRSRTFRRSEERRVGKERRSGWSAFSEIEKRLA